MMPLRYAITIHWSDEDDAFLVSLPDWSAIYGDPVTHGDSDQEALSNALDVLAMSVEIAMERGESLPEPSWRTAASVA